MARALSNAGIVTSNISTQPEIEYRYRLTQNISSKEALKVECINQQCITALDFRVAEACMAASTNTVYKRTQV